MVSELFTQIQQHSVFQLDNHCSSRGYKTTYSLNAFMAFHWLFVYPAHREANLFSCSAFLLFYSEILVLFCNPSDISQLKLLVCDAIFYAVFKVFFAFLVLQHNTPVHSLCVLMSRFLLSHCFFCVYKTQGKIYVLSLDKISFHYFSHS